MDTSNLISVDSLGSGHRWVRPAGLAIALIIGALTLFALLPAPADAARQPYRGESSFQFPNLNCREQSNGFFRISAIGKGWANRVPAEEAGKKKSLYYLKLALQIDRWRSLGIGWRKEVGQTFTSKYFDRFWFSSAREVSMVLGPVNATQSYMSAKLRVTLKRVRHGLPDKTYWAFTKRSRSFSCSQFS